MVLANKISDPIYGMVKSFALKGMLLDRQTLENLAESKNLEELMTKLKATTYNEAISKVTRPYSANKFELAFREHMIRVHSSLVRVSPRSDFLIAHYLRFIAGNLKTVLKGKAIGKGYDEIAGHVDLYAEETAGRRDVILKALAAQNLDTSVEMLKDTEFGSDAAAALEAYKSTGQLQVFDLYLDRAFYANLLNTFNKFGGTGIVRELLTLDLDSYNILAVLRAKIWSLLPSASRTLIIDNSLGVGFHILEAMIKSESIEEALRLLKGSPYAKIVSTVASSERTQLLRTIEDGFARMIYEKASSPFLLEVFGLGPIVGLLKLKEIEVRNLSAITFGVEQSIGFAAITSTFITS